MPRSWFPAVCTAGTLLLLSACGSEDTPAAAPSPVAAPAPDVVTVTRVVEGDTVDVSDGRSIRVLGIDSCELGTDGGRDAVDMATTRLLNKPVTLVAEPGVDRDPAGRVLRYVQEPGGQDFGKAMVPFPHTGVSVGDGASPVYLQELRPLDGDGRTCDRPEPAPTTVAAPPPVADDDSDGNSDRPYVPAPPRDDSGSSRSDNDSGGSNDANDSGSSGSKPRSGQSGHPCLPGERDGDGDGYCGEGR